MSPANLSEPAASLYEGFIFTNPTELSVEDFRPGYPQFSALVGADPAFHICRRFARTRMRLLIHAQDKITVLEQKLDQIDHTECNPLYLGANRLDNNPERLEVLRDLEKSLDAYDGLLLRNSKALSYQKATIRDVQSLRRWVEGTGCLARDETAFLDHEDDLVNLVGPFDHAAAQVEPLIEECLIYLANLFHVSLPRKFSRNGRIFFLPSTFLHIITQVTICMIAIAILWIPTILLGRIHSRTGLLTAMFFAASIFTLVMSILSKARTVEIFVAGAGYAAVLVVFISGNSVHTAG